MRQLTAAVAFVLSLLAIPFVEVNQARPNLPPVVYSADLSQTAQERADALAKAQTLDHSGTVQATQRLMDRGYRLIGENLWRGNMEPVAAEVVQGWVNSPPHNAALKLPEIKQAGWGSAKGLDGFWYVVLLVGNK